MEKVKLIIKSSLFAIFIIATLIFLFTGESSKEKIDIAPPPAPEVNEPDNGQTEGEEGELEGDQVDGEGSQPDSIPEPPEQIDVDDTSSENRPLVIQTTQDEIDGHTLLVENNNFELYFKENNLSIIMRDKKSGAVMYSTVDKPVKSNEQWENFMSSSIILEYLVGTNVVTHRADMFTGNPDIDVKYESDGFSANVYYSELELGYEMQVKLLESGITVEIPQEKIVEDGNKNKVSGFYVYPFLGYSKLGERDGYMFIPDGSGALIHLDDKDGKYKQPYSEMVYGDNVGIDDPHVLSLFNRMNPFIDPEKILAPVFGMVQTDSEIGYLGIIEKGDLSAKIEAYPNGAILPYNWITSRFIYRQVYNQPTSKDSGTIVVRQKNLNHFDIKVRYEFVTNNEASYVGLAKKYQNYLLDNEIIEKQEDDFKVRVDLFGADVEKGLVFKKKVPMTTFEQANSILNDLQSDGVEDILSVYKGWQNNGYYGGLPILSFNPEKSLSGEIKLDELMSESKQNGIEMYLYHDALRYNADEMGSSKYKMMKKYNKRTYKDQVFGKVYRDFNYLNPKSSIDIMTKMQKEYKDNEIENILISGISNEVFSYSENNKEYDRIHTKEQYDSIFTQYNENFNLLLEQPFSYLWKYTDKLIDVPTQSSDYVFTDEDIPFLSLVLRGVMPLYSEYVNFQANQEEFFLQLIEQGINPSFYITDSDPSQLLYTNSSHIYSSMYDRYESMIKEYYHELKDVYDRTKGSTIKSYERSGGVTEVIYENGIAIYVNYNDKSATFNGIALEGLSYKVVENH